MLERENSQNSYPWSALPFRQACTLNRIYMSCGLVCNHKCSFSVEVFDSDRLGKDKSLGSVEIRQDDLIGDEPKWFPLKVIN